LQSLLFVVNEDLFGVVCLVGEGSTVSRVPYLSLGDRWGSFYSKLDGTKEKVVRPERFELPAYPAELRAHLGRRSLRLTQIERKRL
jgi:hypothetical protein